MSRLLLLTVVMGCRGDLDDGTSPVVPVNTTIDAFAAAAADDDDDVDGERTIAPPFLGIDDPADLPVQLLMVVVMRDEGDLADGDGNFSVGDRDEVAATASCRKIRSLRRRYHSSE